MLQCLSGSFKYGFEYLGAATRQPMTAETDRAFFHLTQAVTARTSVLFSDDAVNADLFDLAEYVIIILISNDLILVRQGRIL